MKLRLYVSCDGSDGCMVVGTPGPRVTYSYEALLQYAESPLSKLPPAGLAAFPPELARKVTPARRLRPAPPPALPPPPPTYRAYTPFHHPNYLAALLCRNFYWPPYTAPCTLHPAPCTPASQRHHTLPTYIHIPLVKTRGSPPTEKRVTIIFSYRVTYNSSWARNYLMVSRFLAGSGGTRTCLTAILDDSILCPTHFSSCFDIQIIPVNWVHT